MKRKRSPVLRLPVCVLPGFFLLLCASTAVQGQTLRRIQGGRPWLQHVATDSAHRVWTALDREGVQVLVPGTSPPAPTGNPWVLFTAGNSGLPNNNPLCLLPEGASGVWIGTSVGGLAYLDHGASISDLSDDRWAVYNPETTHQGLTDTFVYSLAAGTGGLKWIGTQEGGLFCLDDGGTPLDPEDDRWLRFGEQDGLACPWVYSITPLGPSSRWLATWGGGLNFFDDAGTPFDKSDDRWVRFTRSDGLPGDIVRSVARDPAGGAWIATLGGLAYLDDGGTPFAKQDDRWVRFLPADGLPSLNVMDVAVGPDGTVWLALWGGGPACLGAAGCHGGAARLDCGGTPLDKASCSWTYFGVEDGLTELIVFCLHAGDPGLLWLGTWGDGLILHAFPSR